MWQLKAPGGKDLKRDQDPDFPVIEQAGGIFKEGLLDNSKGFSRVESQICLQH